MGANLVRGTTAYPSAYLLHRGLSGLLGFDLPIASAIISDGGTPDFTSWRSQITTKLDPSGVDVTNIGKLVSDGHATRLHVRLPIVLGGKTEVPIDGDVLNTDPANVRLAWIGDYEANGGDGLPGFGAASGITVRQRDRFNAIIGGSIDADLQWMVDELFRLGLDSVAIDFGVSNECNSPSNPWHCSPPELFRDAHRHIVDVCRARAVSQHGGWPAGWKFGFTVLELSNGALQRGTWTNTHAAFPGREWFDYFGTSIYFSNSAADRRHAIQQVLAGCQKNNVLGYIYEFGVNTTNGAVVSDEDLAEDFHEFTEMMETTPFDAWSALLHFPLENPPTYTAPGGTTWWNIDDPASPYPLRDAAIVNKFRAPQGDWSENGDWAENGDWI